VKLQKKPFIIILATVIFLLIVGLTLFQISKARTFQFFGDLTARVNTNEQVVALTFDDAPTDYTPEVLKTLNDKKIKATFFIIGAELKAHPQIGKSIANAGHELGNHSYSHDRFLLKSQSYIDTEIQTTNKLIRDTGYKGEITFRPPNGKKLLGLPWYLQQHNIKTIMWDVEPDTYVDASADEASKTDFLVKNTLENTKPGSIILIHPFCKSCTSDRAAIGKIIDDLKQKGYRFVTVSELLTYQAASE
jgi:peptidoglycan/xylan/chitin deacetylase (PgdA/CDA1 family)